MSQTLGSQRRDSNQRENTICNSGSVLDIVRSFRASRRRPSRKDAAVQAGIGDGGGLQTHSSLRIGDHFGTKTTILEEQILRSWVVVLRRIKPVAPTVTYLRRRGSERLGMGQIRNVCPESKSEVQRKLRSTVFSSVGITNAVVWRTS